MKKNVMLGILSILFLMILIGFVVFRDTNETIPMSLSVRSGTEIERIASWEDDKGDLYFFLPSYANLADAQIQKKTDDMLYIGLDELTDGMTLECYEIGSPYHLVCTSGVRIQERTVTFLKSAELPTLYIDTQSGSMEYIHTQKGNEESGELRLYDPAGTLCYSGKIDNMNGRGNASWEESEKKPYSLTLDTDADLLGMGSAKRWILLANAMDSSHIRNKLAFELASTMGLEYTAESEWVDLYLNGNYAGLYLLSERNEVHRERVNIAGDGFLVSMEMQNRLVGQHYPHVLTESGLAFRLHYPLSVGTNSMDKVEQTLQTVENALLSENGKDPKTDLTWDSIIDIDSWTRMFLVSEIIGNLDSYKVSQYFYSNGEDGLVYAGPIWDSDKAMGNDDDLGWSITNPDTFVVCRYLNDDFVGPRLIRKLLKNEKFYESVVTLFREEFYPEIGTNLDEIIQQYEETIASAFEMNRVRWQNELNSGTVQEETGQVRDYIYEHMQFLHSAWIEGVEYCQITFRSKPNDQFRTVVSGQTLDYLPLVEDTSSEVFLGWYYSDTNEPFDISQPITDDIEIYAKWEVKSTNKVKQLLKLAPLGCIAIMGIGLVWVEFKRMKRSR